MERIIVQSSAELFSVAQLLAREAAYRYTDLAREMRAYGNEASASIFDQISAVELQREELIVEWAKVEGIHLLSDFDSIEWVDPGVGTDYDAAAQDPIRSTPYRVLAFMVHNAERAFRLFTHLAASTTDDMINEYAEILAQEELDRVALVRSMRRRAWHAERKAHPEDPDIEPAAVESMADLLATSASLERCVLANLAALLEDYPQLQQLIGHSEEAISEIDELAGASVASGEAAGSNIEAIEAYGMSIAKLAGDSEELLRRLYTDSDRCFMFYDAIVMHSEDEAVMLRGQHLAVAALERLDLLRELMRPKADQVVPIQKRL